MKKNPINSYINKVTKDMGPKQTKEVSEELKTHILDSADELAIKQNVEVNETLIMEILHRMGAPEKVAQMYPKKTTSKGKIRHTVSRIVKFTVTFTIAAAIIWIAFYLYFKDVKFNVSSFIVTFIIYLILLILHPISHMKIFSSWFSRTK